MAQTEKAPFDPKPKFWLGRLVVTANAEEEVEHEDIHNSVNRHLSGDWGDVCPSEPYATHYFCPEAFEPGGARIPAEILRERLPRTLELAEERQRKLYKATDAEVEDVKESYRQFVALCERKERETGEAVHIIASY